MSERGLQNYQKLTKPQFRNRVKKILHQKNRTELLNWTKSYKKVDFQACEKEEFEMKSYFKTMNIASSRLYFKIQNSITPTIKLNFKSDQKFRKMKFVCSDCIEDENANLSQSMSLEPGRVQLEISSRKYLGYPDSQNHQMLFCQANTDLRKVRNLLENEMIVYPFSSNYWKEE